MIPFDAPGILEYAHVVPPSVVLMNPEGALLSVSTVHAQQTRSLTGENTTTISLEGILEFCACQSDCERESEGRSDTTKRKRIVVSIMYLPVTVKPQQHVPQGATAGLRRTAAPGMQPQRLTKNSTMGGGGNKNACYKLMYPRYMLTKQPEKKRKGGLLSRLTGVRICIGVRVEDCARGYAKLLVKAL
jgi:hypothetical protein